EAGTHCPADVAAALLVDQRERWRCGERVPAETYLRLYPDLSADDEFVLEIIYGEFLLREERHEAADGESFLQRFPAHAQRLKQQVELHEAMKDHGHKTSFAEIEDGGLVTQPAAPESVALGPGRNLGRFRIRRELGSGGFGTVFLAFDPDLDREVALKV